MSLFVPKDRRSLFRQFLSGMYDAVVITDPNGHILDINQRAVEHFGRELDDVLDKQVSVFIPGLQPEVVQRIRKGIAGDQHVVIDANGVNREGRKLACEVTVSAIDLMNPGDLVFTIRNVERRRQLMSSLRSKANAFDNAQSALFACSADGKITTANKAFCELFGLKGETEACEHEFCDFMGDEPLPEDFRKALAGETTITGIVAEGDEGEKEELEVVLAPNVVGRRGTGIVGSLLKVTHHAR